MQVCTCWRKIQKDAKDFQTKVEPNFLRGTWLTCWNCLTHGGIILDTITHARLKCLSHTHLYALIIELFVEAEISLTSKIRWNHDKQDLMNKNGVRQIDMIIIDIFPIPRVHFQRSRDFDQWKIPGSRDSRDPVRACSGVSESQESRESSNIGEKPNKCN